MTPASGKPPEERARELIDARLAAAGWEVQHRDEMNLSAGKGVAVREFKLSKGHGFVDYLLFVDKKPVGVLEAKAEGYPLSGVEPQAKLYAEGLPDTLKAPVRPLPFVYLSNGHERTFANLLDPEPRSRPLFHFHRPETLAEWIAAKALADFAHPWRSGLELAQPDGQRELLGDRPSTLRSRLRAMPPIDFPDLWPNKVEALTNLEESLFHDRPRSLIQMATGSGKTKLAIAAIYRLVKFADARRVLFLVDRSNLGEQAEKEFQGFVTPVEHRKFTELYNVQRLTTNQIGASSKVVVTTIQRLYSMLRGEEALDPALEEDSQYDANGGEVHEPQPVVYNPAIPVEAFDIIFVDECHRSIYSRWRQVLEYFDAYLIGLTATPAKHTYGFFNQNVVMEYPHERAVADGVNVDFEVYTIRTRITQEGSTIEAEPQIPLPVRDRKTRALSWQTPDEDITYAASDLDKSVVAKDQIRTIVRTFKERLPIDIFPGRKKVPKTLIFAKDDSHAEDIVAIVREEFGKGNDFCQKITYKTTGKKPAELIQDFRNSYNPRIAVTVDMIATGTDIKPVEIVMFMREVKSRVYFEQMKGRGVRVIDRDELRAVTPDADAKTHFVIVDCVGISDAELGETHPLERKKSVSFKALLEHVAAGGTDPELLSTLASRLARLDRQCGPDERDLIAAAGDGAELSALTGAILQALDPDRVEADARQRFELAPEANPTPDQLEEARHELCTLAVAPLATQPKLRKTLIEIKESFEQILDEISKDELLEAGPSVEATERARALVTDFETFLSENRDEIDALQLFYSQPYARRLTFEDIKALATAIQAPPRSWTPDLLWRAYQILDASKVRGSAQRILTNLVSLVRYALHQDDELAPYPDLVQQRFDRWLAQQANSGREFTAQQVRWLEMIRDHIGMSMAIEPRDFEYTPFAEQGGFARAASVFGSGDDLRGLLEELTQELAA